MSEPLVVVQGLSKSFQPRHGLVARLRGLQGPAVQAVRDVSFRIARGTTFALVGESGSGKSTIARMVTGLLAPSSGSVRIGGLPVNGTVASRRALRAKIQMVFQDPYSSLNPRWRVNAVIAEPIRALAPRSGRTEMWHRVAELLELVGLHPADALRYPHEFSGGQRQRIAIARALATGAELIVCDEPTSALDVSVQAQILNLMRDLQQRLGLTYLFISHNLAVVRTMADTVGVLSQGQLVESGQAEQIFADPLHAYTRALLAAIPSLETQIAATGEVI